MNCRVNGSAPIDWLVDGCRIFPNRERGIFTSPYDIGTDMISLVEQVAYAGVRSDKIVNDLLESVKWTSEKTGLDKHIVSDMQGVVY